MSGLTTAATPAAAASSGPGSPGRCRVMGILNVTPDSFSDGGRFVRADAAVRHGLLMAGQGADIIDVGGESTRPGAPRVPVEEELSRVLPVVRELSGAGVAVSIDTMRSAVAEAAVEAGAILVNDVSGGLADPSMARAVAGLGTPYVAMHWRAHSWEMHRHARYRDVVGDVVTELRARLDDLVAGGIAPERIVVDPGLGFAKTAEHSWRLLRGLDALRRLGRPVLVGASRKSFLARFAEDAADRDTATAAVTAIAAAGGAYAVRVHDVATSAVAVRVAAAMRPAAGTGEDGGSRVPPATTQRHETPVRRRPADGSVRCAPTSIMISTGPPQPSS